MNLLDQEPFVNAPEAVKEVIQFTLKHQKPIRFKVPGHGEFETLEFHSEKASIREFYSVEHPDYYQLPYTAHQKITSFLDERKPVLTYQSVQPFARSIWGDRMHYLYFDGMGDIPLLINIDNGRTKPVSLQMSIRELLPLKSLQEERDYWCFKTSRAFEEEIQGIPYLISPPDGIFEANDYRALIDSLLQLSQQSYLFEMSVLPEPDEDYYEVELRLNQYQNRFRFRKGSHYVDENGLITALNELLSGSALLHGHLYVQLRTDEVDFGIALANASQRGLLAQRGLGNLKQEELTTAEQTLIEAYQDRIRTLKELLFYIEVQLKDLSPEYKGQVIPVQIEVTLSEADQDYLLQNKNIRKIEKDEEGFVLHIEVG